MRTEYFFSSILTWAGAGAGGVAGAAGDTVGVGQRSPSCSACGIGIEKLSSYTQRIWRVESKKILLSLVEDVGVVNPKRVLELCESKPTSRGCSRREATVAVVSPRAGVAEAAKVSQTGPLALNRWWSFASPPCYAVLECLRWLLNVEFQCALSNMNRRLHGAR